VSGRSGWVAVLALAAACGRGRDPPAAAALDSLLARGERLHFAGEYDSARTVLDRALESSRASHDTVREARALTQYGLTLWRQGDYGQARRLGEQALALKLGLDLRSDLFKSYNALGLLAWNEGRHTDALELFARAAEAARAARDRKGLGAVSGNLGLVRTELGDFDAARRRFEEAASLGREIGDARVEGNALNNLGMLDVRVGDPEAALPRLRRARELYQSINYVTGLQQNIGQLGTALLALGEPQRAFAALDSALAWSRQQGLRQEEASNLEALADLHHQAGDGRRALGLLGEARALDSALGLDEEFAANLRASAEVRRALGELDGAVVAAAEALATHRRLEARFEELSDLILLAELAQAGGERREAISHLRAARGLARELDVRLARDRVALAGARHADREGDPRGVLARLAESGPGRAARGYDMDWEAEALRARAFLRLGRLDSAVAAGRRAVAGVEWVRGGFGSSVLRTRYLVARRDAFADLVEALLRSGRTEEAFEVADAARSSALVEHLAAARGDAAASSGTALSLAEGEQLLRRIAYVSEQIATLEEEGADSSTAVQRRQLVEVLARARAEYEALLVGAAERDPRAAMLGVGAVSAAQVRRWLRPGEVLLEYFVAPERLTVFVVTPERVQAASTAIGADELGARVRLARELLGRPGGSEAPGVLERLFDVLVAPVMGAGLASGARTLIVVPHAMLTYLPFAALRDARRGRYLIEDVTIAYLPTAAALPVLRDREPPAGVGDAVAAVFAPEPRDLPATPAEAAAVELALDGARSHVGRRATERRLREALRSTAVVHVAGHSVMNATSPMFSRVELAVGRAGRPEDDGRLEVHELLGMTVASRLVFLSGCETGVGTSWSTGFATGEDYATLGLAFLYAGARSVVATVWRINDDGAAAFAERFYRHLRSVTPVEALAQAQREMIGDRRYGAPYYWAAYTLTGAATSETGAQGRAVASVQ